MKEAHLIGNGRSAAMFDHKSTGMRITCNLPPFAVDKVYSTVIVDFKMMYAMREGSVQVPGNWILGYRPKVFCDSFPDFYMKHAHQIKDFYTVLPPYVPNYTDLSCGHMACHYIANVHRPDVIHMYGFDSIFDFDLTSCSDFYLESNRDNTNTLRLTNNWRTIWPPMFEEFPHINFKLYGKHENAKIRIPSNVDIVVKK